MKKSILLPLSLGLMLVGCSRTSTDSNKVSSNDQPNANKPAYDEKATAPPKDSMSQSQVASASTPAPTASGNATAATPAKAPDSAPIAAALAPDSSAMVATSTPTAPAASAEATPSTTPVPPIAAATMPESSQVAVNPPASDAASTASAATENKPATLPSPGDWKLSANDIKSEFESTGRVVRAKPVGIDAPTGPMDDVLVTLVNTKLQADADLASLKLDVAASHGIVTLSGSAHSLDQIGRAVGIVLDVDGVTYATSTIKLIPAP